jgi:hypothetical protein
VRPFREVHIHSKALTVSLTTPLTAPQKTAHSN